MEKDTSIKNKSIYYASAGEFSGIEDRHTPIVGEIQAVGELKQVNGVVNIVLPKGFFASRRVRVLDSVLQQEMDRINSQKVIYPKQPAQLSFDLTTK